MRTAILLIIQSILPFRISMVKHESKWEEDSICTPARARSLIHATQPIFDRQTTYNIQKNKTDRGQYTSDSEASVSEC